MCGVSTLLEKEGRGVEETSGCLWFVLILTKTFPAGYLEQVNSGGWNFCATHWQRWVWYHRNTIQNWGRDLLSTSAHRVFFFSVYIMHIGKRPLCFSSVMCLVEGNEDGDCFVFCFSGCMLLLFWSYFWGWVAFNLLWYQTTNVH